MKRLFLPALSLTLLAHAARAEPEARMPLDFAEGLTLETQPQLAAQTLLLPLDVYRGTRPGLPDIAVFDGEGRPVPYAVRALESKASDERQEEPAPLFALREQAGVPPSDLTLHVERNESGTVVDVRSGGDKPPPAEAKVVAYIVDASNFKHDVAGVHLELGPSDQNFTTSVKVEASDDLGSWRTLVGGAVVGRLRHDDQSVERKRIQFIATSAKFLRLSWPGAELPVPVLSCQLEYTSQRIDFTRARVHTNLPPVPVKNGAYEIDLGNVLALESVQPLLPENALIRATLALRDAESDPRANVFEGPLYRLQHEGNVLASAPITLSAARGRYLTLSVDPRVSGLRGAPLPFDVEYAPDQLVFISNAPGPYLLAYGSYKPAAEPFRAEQLLEFMTPAARDALPRETARVLGQKALTGPSARTAPPPATSYRTPVLWAVLIGGALLLLVLAARLLRKTST